MEVICLEDAAFYALVDKVFNRITKLNNNKQDKWIDNMEVMRMLRIKSKTTLQKMRDSGKIRYTQPEKKVILYDIDSIYDYLEKHAHDTFWPG